jgi:hypothetical protein
MSALTEAATLPRRIPEALRLFLSHGSPRSLLAGTLLAAGARATLGPLSAADLLPPLALAVVWPLQEWLIHVCILHYRPLTLFGRTLDFRLPRSHRAHHAEPWRPELVFIPLHTFTWSLPLIAGFWWLVTPTLALAYTGIAFHLLLALHYEWVHLLVHTHVVPRTALYRRLWRNHRLHHFKNDRYWFGVTMLSGDRILRTAPDPGSVPTALHVPDLGTPRTADVA